MMLCEYGERGLEADKYRNGSRKAMGQDIILTWIRILRLRKEFYFISLPQLDSYRVFFLSLLMGV